MAAAVQSLTRYEWEGLANRHNLADGHARHALRGRGQHILQDLPSIYRRAELADQLELQRGFEFAFYRAAGQHSVPLRAAPPLHHYSSSVSTEVVANWLRASQMCVGLLHPTFDNIAGILQRHGVPLVPVAESILDGEAPETLYEEIDVLFMVLPNNPTGRDPSRACIETIAARCAAHGVVLIIDFCFRFFSNRLGLWDQYESLEASGCRYIGIEDTGKTWPTLDLKVGSLISHESLREELAAVTDDVLLNVSPFVYCLLGEVIVADQPPVAIDVSVENRAELVRCLADTPLQVAPSESEMCVAWVRVDETQLDSSMLVDGLNRSGVSILPGGPFYWADPRDGSGHVRVALARDPERFRDGAAALRDALPAVMGSARSRSSRPAARTGSVAEPMERVVTDVAAAVLGRPVVSRHDDFFALGGNSLSAMHLVGRLRSVTGLPIKVGTLFERSVLADLAAHLEELTAAGGDGAPDLVKVPDRVDYR